MSAQGWLGGIAALGFTRYSGQARDGLLEQLSTAGFASPEMRENGNGFCALARKRLSADGHRQGIA